MAGPDIPFHGGYDIAAILQNTDLVSLVASYGVDVKQSGNSYTCRCFAHDDSNPSMSIYRDESGKQTTHCYSCGTHEDAIGVVKFFDGCSTAEAIRKLSDGHLGNGQFARIYDEPKLKRPERTTMIPPADAGMPRMDYLTDSGGTPFGDPVGVWCYRTPEGAPWYYEARFEIEKTDPKTGEIRRRKEPRCFTWGRLGDNGTAKWGCGHYNKPRPLYGLDQVAAKPKAQIIVCEGPRKADAAQQLLPMVACVGFAGGKNGIKYSDWSPIAGRDVILWPDADDGGRQAFADLAQQLIALGCRVWMLDTTEMPDKWDAADALAEGWDTAQTLAWAKAQKGEQIVAVEPPALEQAPHEDDSIYALPEILPESEPPPSLPPEAYSHEMQDVPWTAEPADLFSAWVVPKLQRGMLPEIVDTYIQDRAHIINTDPAFGALCAIVTCAGLIDDRIKIQVHHDWVESARIWGCIVGEPSTKKSPMMSEILRPVAKIVEKVAREDAEIGRKQDVADKRYQAKLKEYTDACIKSDDHDVPMPPPPTRHERLRVLVKNLTIEGLEEVLKDCPRGVLCPQDEIAGWIGSMDAYRSNGAKKDRALWLEAYNGGPMQIDKIGRGSFLIPNWSVTILGGIQPSKLRELAATMTDDGMLQRFLVVCSDAQGGIGSGDRPDAAAYQRWHDLLDTLYHTKPGGGLVRMSDEASDIRREAVKHIYDIIGTRMISGAFTSHLGKWEGLSARMILTYHCIECASSATHPESAEVSADTARRAIRYMMEHLLPHAVSFYEDGLGQSEVQDVARSVAGRIVAEGITELQVRWLDQRGPNRWRVLPEDKQRQVLARLVEYGWLEAGNLASQLTRRPSRYRVNPNVHTLYARHRAGELARLEAGREIARKIRAGVS